MYSASMVCFGDYTCLLIIAVSIVKETRGQACGMSSSVLHNTPKELRVTSKGNISCAWHCGVSVINFHFEDNFK